MSFTKLTSAYQPIKGSPAGSGSYDPLNVTCSSSSDQSIGNLGASGVRLYASNNEVLRLGSDRVYAMGSEGISFTTSNDVGLKRESAGVLKVTNGSTGLGDVTLETLTFASGYGILSSGYEFNHGPVSITETYYNTSITLGSTQGGPSPGIRVGGPLHPGYLANMHVVGGGSYADNQTAGDVHIHGGQNWAAGTDSNAGSAYVYGGLGSGSGANGDVYLGTDGTTARGMIHLATSLRKSSFDTAPSSASDTGTVGEIRITSTYIYICTATNTWVRTALSTW